MFPTEIGMGVYMAVTFEAESPVYCLASASEWLDDVERQVYCVKAVNLIQDADTANWIFTMYYINTRDEK